MPADSDAAVGLTRVRGARRDPHASAARCAGTRGFFNIQPSTHRSRGPLLHILSARVHRDNRGRGGGGRRDLPQGFRRAPGGRKLGRTGRDSASAPHWRGAPSTGAKAEAPATSAHTQSPRITLFTALLLCMFSLERECSEFSHELFVSFRV